MAESELSAWQAGSAFLGGPTFQHVRHSLIEFWVGAFLLIPIVAEANFGIRRRSTTSPCFFGAIAYFFGMAFFRKTHPTIQMISPGASAALCFFSLLEGALDPAYGLFGGGLMMILTTFFVFHLLHPGVPPEQRESNLAFHGSFLGTLALFCFLAKQNFRASLPPDWLFRITPIEIAILSTTLFFGFALPLYWRLSATHPPTPGSEPGLAPEGESLSTKEASPGSPKVPRGYEATIRVLAVFGIFLGIGGPPRMVPKELVLEFLIGFFLLGILLLRIYLHVVSRRNPPDQGTESPGSDSPQELGGQASHHPTLRKAIAMILLGLGSVAWAWVGLPDKYSLSENIRLKECFSNRQKIIGKILKIFGTAREKGLPEPSIDDEMIASLAGEERSEKCSYSFRKEPIASFTLDCSIHGEMPHRSR